MAWVATEDFTGYTTATDLADQGSPGGTGWASGWQDNGVGHWTAETAPSGLTGISARCGANTNNTHAYREVSTPVTSGTIQWKMKIDRTDPSDYAGIILETVYNTAKIYLTFGSTAGGTGGNGNFGTRNGVTWQSIGATYAANTVYTVALAFDAATDQFTVSIDGAAALGPFNAAATFTDIRIVRLDCSATNGVELWIDDIGPESAPPAVTAPTLYVNRAAIRSN